jgi:putative addiction module component
MPKPLGSFPILRQPEYNRLMSIKEVEAAALRLVPKDRARLAGKLLESLENLSEEEIEFIWAEEAERRDAAWTSADSARTAKRVLRSARAKLR